MNSLTSHMNTPLVIEYYTDILCVWAWIAQRRIDELHQQLGAQIEFRYYYMDIFGDVPTKLNRNWKQKGGYEGFANHVQKTVSPFEDVPINANTWAKVRPTTSANAHLMLKAVEIVYDKKKSIEIALMLRNAFFVDAQDIGNLEILSHLVEAAGLDRNAINSSIQNGTAMAALMNDYQKSKQQNIKGSPSYVMDGGRQILYGNVGYRVLYSNIEELLKHPQDEASWC